MFSAQKKILSFVFLFLAGLLVFLGWMFVRRSTKELPPQALSPPIVTPPTSSTPYVQTGTTAVMKTYRNIEFSFEFRYPENWGIIENPYGSPFSKFNLIIVPEEEKYLPDPILVNITVPEFADNAFHDLSGIDVVVDNISGRKYEYQEEGLSEISIVLPFGTNKIILGANKKYEDIFNQVLSMFKFLK